MTTTARASREIDGQGRTIRELLARQALYLQLAEQIWSPNRLAKEVAS